MFSLNKLEKVRTELFQERHYYCEYKSTIGGKFAYQFVPNGVGGTIVIKCLSCGEFKDVTDYDSW